MELLKILKNNQEIEITLNLKEKYIKINHITINKEDTKLLDVLEQKTEEYLTIVKDDETIIYLQKILNCIYALRIEFSKEILQ